MRWKKVWEDQKQRIPGSLLGGEATSIRFRMEADFTDMKDTAVFYYEKDGKWLQLGTEKKLYFGLDHFSAAAGLTVLLCNDGNRWQQYFLQISRYEMDFKSRKERGKLCQ